MNNRFKFRAWNKEDKKMYAVEGVYAYEDEYTQGGEVFLQWFKTSHYFPEQVELMQCTGLKDKNGKLIYEGDIVKAFDEPDREGWFNEWTGKIIYSNKDSQLLLETELYRNFAKGDLSKYPDFCHFEFSELKEIEVIGNIYENKELLNE